MLCWRACGGGWAGAQQLLDCRVCSRLHPAGDHQPSTPPQPTCCLSANHPQAVAAPQELHAGILAVNAHCRRVLEAKDGTLAAARALLARRDEQYTKLLQLQVRVGGSSLPACLPGVHILARRHSCCAVHTPLRCPAVPAERGDGRADCHDA